MFQLHLFDIDITRALTFLRDYIKPLCSSCCNIVFHMNCRLQVIFLVN